MTARVTTGNPCSHLAHSRAIITNHFITPSALWLSRHLYSAPASVGLRKCLDVKFKQHKCLAAKQSSSESCGTQSSFFLVWGRERVCGGELWSWSFRGGVPWKLHSFLESVQFMRETTSQVSIGGSTFLPLADLQPPGALQPKIDLDFLYLSLNLPCLHLAQLRT